MADLPEALARRIAAIRDDHSSGASEILDEVLAVLAEARAVDTALPPVARALCQAQPGMAPVWNAALEALASETDAPRLARFTHRVSRAGAALVRYAAAHFAATDAARPLHVVTLSFSRSVALVVEHLHGGRSLRVSCSESRPALEGRRLASRLAGAGIPVTCFSDAALAHALADAEAVVVGADAVGPEWFLNKSGTRALAAVASQQGVSVYVLATRDKFVSRAVSAHLVNREGAPAEIWGVPPAGVAVRNPYFERTPLDLVTAVISDLGVLDAAMVVQACDAAQDALAVRALDELIGDTGGTSPRA